MHNLVRKLLFVAAVYTAGLQQRAADQRVMSDARCRGLHQSTVVSGPWTTQQLTEHWDLSVSSRTGRRSASVTTVTADLALDNISLAIVLYTRGITYQSTVLTFQIYAVLNADSIHRF